MYRTSSREHARLPHAFALALALVGSAWLANGDALAGAANDPSATAAAAASANATVEKYAQPVHEITPNGKPFDALKAVKGKSIGVVSGDTVSAGFQQMYTAYSAAAKTLGVKTSLCDGQLYKVAEISRCIGRFKGEHVDAIVLLFVDPNLVQGPLKQAHDAGIPIETVNAAIEGAPLATNVDSQVSYTYKLAAELEAKTVIALSGANAKTLIITSNEYANSLQLTKVIEDTFKSKCGDTCAYVTRDIALADYEQRMVSLVKSTVQSDRNINYVIALYDNAVPQVLAGIRSANASDRVKVISFGGSTGAVDFVRQSGSSYVADVGSWPEQLGWATADAAARLLAGERDTAALRDAKISPRIFDKKNVGTIDLSKPTTWYGNLDVASHYKKQWQMD